MPRVHEEFNNGRQHKLDYYEYWNQEDCNSDEWNFLESLTFDSYATAFSSIFRNNTSPYLLDDKEKKQLDPILKYILYENEECMFWIFRTDFRIVIRLACEVVPEKTYVVQDLTDVIRLGEYSENEPICDNAIRGLVAQHSENSSQIILTEGSTDAWILQESLSILYPHLSSYYSFLDFKSSKSRGGADHLVLLLKAFSGSEITNRIIAIFDNDTAAYEATSNLNTVSLPENICVLHYPNLGLLQTYPKHGSGGLSSLDVNGLAGLSWGGNIARGRRCFNTRSMEGI